MSKITVNVKFADGTQGTADVDLTNVTLVQTTFSSGNTGFRMVGQMSTPKGERLYLSGQAARPKADRPAKPAKQRVEF